MLFVISLCIITYWIGANYIQHFNSRIDIYYLIFYGSILIGILDSKKNSFLARIFLFLIVLSFIIIYILRISDMTLFHPYSSIFYNVDFIRDHHSIYVDYW